MPTNPEVLPATPAPSGGAFPPAPNPPTTDIAIAAPTPGQLALAPFDREHAELLFAQDVYAELVVTGRADEAYCRYRRTNKTNVYVALSLFGVLTERPGLLEIAFGLLRQNCASIARQKGLRDRGKLNEDVYLGGCNRLLSELLRLYPTSLDTARLLLKHQLPDGRFANYGRILEHRLLAELGYADWRQKQAAARANGIDELFPDITEENYWSIPYPERTPAEPWRISGADRLVEIIDELKEGLRPREIALWDAASEIKAVPSRHWEDVRGEFADPRTGVAPTATALRQQWSRLRTRLRAAYQRITGRVHLTALIISSPDLSQNGVS